jgi:hypothetical protein
VSSPRPLVNLPIVTFLYTLDQIAAMINVSMHDLHYKHLYFHLRSTGRKPRTQMMARNIAPDDEPPEWRVSHTDFVRWLSGNGFEFSQPRVL